MNQIDKHPLLEQCYELCQAIEACGSSPALTNAVTKATELRQNLEKCLDPVAVLTYKGYLLHASDPKALEHSEPTPLFDLDIKGY